MSKQSQALTQHLPACCLRSAQFDFCGHCNNGGDQNPGRVRKPYGTDLEFALLLRSLTSKIVIIFSRRVILVLLVDAVKDVDTKTNWSANLR